MATSRTTYLGELRTENEHIRSSVKIITDAPVDNQGKGEAFSPTDLVATALADCMITIMGIKAREKGLDLTGTILETTKIMSSEPRRIGEIIIEITFPKNGFSDKDKAIFAAITKSCPVALSLHPEVKQTIILNW
ncbi:MAG: OsmC family protein [Mariniphaga sp.]